MNEKANQNGGEEDEADGQEQNGTEISPELAPGGEDGRRVEQRREETEENEFGLEVDVRQARNEREEQSGEHEQHRIWNGDAAGEPGQAGNRREQTQDYLDRLRHCARNLRARKAKATANKKLHPRQAGVE